MSRFTDLYGNAFKNYANFEGRACRAEALAFLLTNGIIISIIFWIGFIFVFGGAMADNGGVAAIGAILFILAGIIGLVVLVPSWALGARRLHDLNQSGWWQVLIYIANFIPVINYVAWIAPIVIFYCLPGTEGDNNYGPVSEKY